MAPFSPLLVKRVNEYRVVPGVANLSAPQALNNASFLYNAVLNTGPWAGRGQHVANGLLLIKGALPGPNGSLVFVRRSVTARVSKAK